MMTEHDTAQRIRSLLEPHGYRYVRPGNKRDGNRVVTDDWWSDRGDGGHDKTPEDCWLLALIHFLNDKAQTGARIADLGWQEFDYIDLRLCLEDRLDPDEFVARNWLTVHNLPDPRKQVTP